MRNYNQLYSGLLILSMLTMVACNRDAEKSPEQTGGKSIPVISETVKTETLPQSIAISGNVDGSKTVRLGFMVAGKINSLPLQEGQHVRSGQLIASLDPANYSIAKEIADIQVSQATDEFGRLKSMYEKNSLSESDYKKIDFTLQGARAQQKLHEKNLADTRLYAPISGILLKKLAEPGEIVGSGTPILVVSDISKVKVNAYLPENKLSEVKLGQNAEVAIGALDKTFTGKVVEVGGVAEATTRAFTIKIEVANPDRLIRPGMIAEIKMTSGREQSLIAIPTTAILRAPEGDTYVYIEENGKAFRRNISIGAVTGDRVEVLSGLKDGEKIVTGGQHKLTNGAMVSAQN